MVEGEEGRTGRSAATFPGERLGSRSPLSAGPEAARAVTTEPCQNHPPISINIKIKRIASDSFG